MWFPRLLTSSQFQVNCSTLGSIFMKILCRKVWSCVWEVPMEFNGVSKTGLRSWIRLPYPEIPCSSHCYSKNDPTEFNCLKILGIDSLEKRRIMMDLKVVAKTWTGRIDCETFIQNFNINVPMRRTRGSDPFRLHSFRTEIGWHLVFNRLMSNFDLYCRGGPKRNFCDPIMN